MSNRLLNNLERINGISTPVGGVSWDNKPREKDIAKKVVVHLEGCRVLCLQFHMIPEYDIEYTRYGIESILKIKDFLTKTLEDIPYNGPNRSELENWLREMREACNVFLTSLEESKFTRKINSESMEDYDEAQRIYAGSLGNMRRVFWKNIEKISKEYEIEIEDKELRSTIRLVAGEIDHSASC